MLMKWRTTIFFYLKAPSGFPGNNFSKTTDDSVKITDIKIVKVDKCSPYTFTFKTP
jgi:hypothetical protein